VLPLDLVLDLDGALAMLCLSFDVEPPTEEGAITTDVSLL